MSRSGYSDDCDGWDLIRWRGAVASAIRGKRGQAMLQEMLQALDAMPDKRLVSESLVTSDGDYCTLGALGRARGMDMGGIGPEDRESVARAFGISEALAAEIMYLNDEGVVSNTRWIEVEICGPVRPNFPEWGKHSKTVSIANENAAKQRWSYMRSWVESNLKTRVFNIS